MGSAEAEPRPQARHATLSTVILQSANVVSRVVDPHSQPQQQHHEGSSGPLANAEGATETASGQTKAGRHHQTCGRPNARNGRAQPFLRLVVTWVVVVG